MDTILIEKPQEKGQLNAPIRRWKDDIKMDARETK
jgi:hypothetical protein